MDQIFNKIENFFISLNKELNFTRIMLIAVGLFLLISIVIIIFCMNSYENKLLRTITHFNKYFQINPKIDETNLVAFNNKMRADGVPKQLRKQWQTYVLYQEHKASEYMSYENCVVEPMKNSTYSRDVKTLNYTSIIIALVSLVLNCFHAYQVAFVEVIRTVLITPAIIVILNCLITIFLNARHTSIIADLANNYQYFEVNIDKATATIPSYVDYEVLFDKNEIKSGIPVLYEYLQNRAAQEQKELDVARLKNIEHDKFNFDEMGDNAALVLERALQEAENYIAERKKFAQDIEQINNEMAQEDIQYREYTKDYNRQMQVSKETFANFKQQLDDSTSTIQSNYLKKQQQQELDRQRNLERDFDIATEKHKKVVDSFHDDLNGVEEDRNQSRKALEDAMKAEFTTYNSKVYNAVRASLKEEENDKLNKAKQRIEALEEELAKKNQMLKRYQDGDFSGGSNDSTETDSGNSGYTPIDTEDTKYTQPISSDTEQEESSSNDNGGFTFNYLPTEDELMAEKEKNLQELQEERNEFKYVPDEDKGETSTDDSTTEDESDNEEPITVSRRGRPRKEQVVETKPAGRRGRPKKVATEKPVEIQSVGRRGRPKKEVQVAISTQQSRRGRPRKIAEEPKPVAIKRGRGRPAGTKKIEESVKIVKRAGRPKKAETNQTKEVVGIKKSGRGRPRKNINEVGATNKVAIAKKPKGRPGRPAGSSAGGSDLDDMDKFLREIDEAIKFENDKMKKASEALEKGTITTKRSKK